MKHLIIGSGVVGTATGVWLNANCEDVIFYDIKSQVLEKLDIKGFKTTSKIDIKVDIYWICTAEWNVEEVLSELLNYFKNPTIVIRSTTPPGMIERLSKKYKLKHIAHIPEFLKAKTAISDIFDKDRVIVGTNDEETKSKLSISNSTYHIYHSYNFRINKICIKLLACYADLLLERNKGYMQ